MDRFFTTTNLWAMLVILLLISPVFIDDIQAIIRHRRQRIEDAKNARDAARIDKLFNR